MGRAPRCSSSLMGAFALLLSACAETGDPPAVGAPAPSAIDQGDPTDAVSGLAQAGDGDIYRVRYTGNPGDTPEIVRREMLSAAAKLARDQGHSHFAVIEERIETVTGTGPVSSVGASVPVVRSGRGGRRSGSGSVTLGLGSPTANSALGRIVPFSGDPPTGAAAVYSAADFK